MKWVKKIGLGLVLSASLALVGCGQQNQTSQNGVETIEYFNQKKEMSKTLKEIAADFEKENPKIHVKVVDVPNPGDVLKTRMLAGDIPDVVNLYPQNIDFQEWAKAGYFEDLTQKSYLKRIKNNYAEKFAINDKIYNVPLSANVYGFYYNKTAFKKLGLTPPKTWAEFEQLVSTIKAKKQTAFAIAGTEGWTLNGYHQLALATITGGGKQANQLLRFSKVNGISAKSKAMQADFNRLDLLRRPGAMQKNWQGAGYNDAVVAFAKGNALIMPNGSWALPVIKQQEPKFEIGTFAFPAAEAGKELTVGSADLAMSISAKSKHKKAANKFVEYFTRATTMQKYYDVDGSPVAVKGVKTKKNATELAGLTRLAFTKRHMVWLAQDWTSENDFFTATTNYLSTGNKQELVRDLNTFFNPMKADVKK
ncbi:extracellular solute-binding protein [Lapidilactobacillus luobeiensis]|uniref:extracellular solute-binding protein n=1 Tax=Lapidilactobacillus luobeiensis TaxID=2950371 RepID=UPI0021C4033C|nr:extracellular solute-binding protein [Lapidilactobacillus luobeiensis]